MTGEVAALEWIRDRIVRSISKDRLAALDTDLRALRTASTAGNLAAAGDLAARAAARLRRT